MGIEVVTITTDFTESEPHTVTYMDETTVTYDYSDESRLRELQLY